MYSFMYNFGKLITCLNGHFHGRIVLNYEETVDFLQFASGCCIGFILDQLLCNYLSLFEQFLIVLLWHSTRSLLCEENIAFIKITARKL